MEIDGWIYRQIDLDVKVSSFCTDLDIYYGIIANANLSGAGIAISTQP